MKVTSFRDSDSGLIVLNFRRDDGEMGSFAVGSQAYFESLKIGAASRAELGKATPLDVAVLQFAEHEEVAEGLRPMGYSPATREKRFKVGPSQLTESEMKTYGFKAVGSAPTKAQTFNLHQHLKSLDGADKLKANSYIDALSKRRQLGYANSWLGNGTLNPAGQRFKARFKQHIASLPSNELQKLASVCRCSTAQLESFAGVKNTKTDNSSKLPASLRQFSNEVPKALPKNNGCWGVFSA